MTFRVEIPARRQIKGGAWVEGSFHAFAATVDGGIAQLALSKNQANRIAGHSIIIDTGDPIITEIDLPLAEAIAQDLSPLGYWPDLGIGVMP